MRNYLTKVRLQTLAVVGTSDLPRVGGQPLPKQLRDASGNTYTSSSSMDSIVSSTNAMIITPVPTTSQLMRMTFSSIPVIWQAELDKDYQELGQALGQMTELNGPDGWTIDPAVYNVASRVAVELLANSYPAPQIFSHGSKSVVFNWSQGPTNLYLTISSDFISALVSSPERIQRRLRFAQKDLLESSVVFRALLSVHAGQPIVSKDNATSQTSEFSE